MSRSHIIVSMSVCALLAGAAGANPVQGEYRDLPDCDNHGTLLALEELGRAPIFDPDEQINTDSLITTLSACPITDDPALPNTLVIMINNTGRHWTDLFYNADPETIFTNIDGLGESFAVPGVATPTFRIDAVGLNRPLIFESLTPDGIFEPGETWEFIIDDYFNAFGLGAWQMESLDFAGASAGDSLSSGSVVQFIPAPGGSVALLAAGGMLLRRRRN